MRQAMLLWPSPPFETYRYFEISSVLKPEKILDEIGITAGNIVADFGAGSGFYTIPLAKKVGPDGKVYGIDILEPVLDIIRSNARAANLSNIEFIRSDLEKEKGSTLADNSCDYVLIANVLFQSGKKPALLREAHRILKDQGKLAVIDWYPEKIPGAKSLHPVNPEEVKKLASEARFLYERELEVDPVHFGLMFKKQS